MRARSTLAALGASLALVPSVAARYGMPEPVTGRGQLIESIYAHIAVVAIGVFVLVMSLLVFVLVRYRASTGRGRATHERHRGSLAAEAVWTVIPLGIMLWIGVMSYQGLVELDERREADLELRITGAQWTWIADYGDGVTVSSSPDGITGAVADGNVFVVPADTPIDLNVTGADVIHSFYIQDARGGPVGMVDANPSGPHRHSHFVVDLPEGEYRVQCKELCHNPGHAIMRARIHAVPRADFDFWLEKRQLAVGADLPVEMALAPADLAGADRTVAAGSRLIVTFSNPGASDLTLNATGRDDVTVPAGGHAVFPWEIPTAGRYELSGGGQALGFEAIEAVPVQVTLGAFELLPDHVELQVGTTYLFQLQNTHSVPHNLFLGHFGQEVLAQSPDAGPGASAAFLYTPEAAGELEMWCNVPGHHGLGMHGTVTVA